MSATREIEALLAADRGAKYDIRQLNEALPESITYNNISVALNELIKTGRISRVKRPTGNGYFYFLPPLGQPIRIEQRGAQQRAAAPPKVQAGDAKQLARRARKPNERIDTSDLVIPAGVAPADEPERMWFAISDDGSLGISQDGAAGVRVAPDSVRRLFAFLEKTRTLWGAP